MGRIRAIHRTLWLFLGLLLVSPAGAQERPVKRLAMILSVAMTEYGFAVDDQGKVINDIE